MKKEEKGWNNPPSSKGGLKMFKECVDDEKCCATCDHWYAEETYDGDTFPFCELHRIKLNPYDWDDQVCDDWKE